MTTTLKMYNGDIVRNFSNQGYEQLSDTDKLRQDVAMSLTSDVRPLTGVGCGLDQLIGTDPTNEISQYSMFPIMFEFQTRVRGGLNRLRSNQRSFNFANRTLKELIYDFSAAEVWQTPEDPRSYKFRVDVISEDGSTQFSVGGGARG